MRVPMGLLAEYVDVAPGTTGREVAAALVGVGLEEESLHGGDIRGPLVVGRVLEISEETASNGKTIRFCRVDVGANGQQVTQGIAQEIVCGAHNFAVGDLVVVILPGGVLPGGFAITARRTYGHVSNGMICSATELGLPDATGGAGIIVLGELLEADDLAGVEPGQDAIVLLGLGEQTVEVNVTPDRGYCFSVRGIAREYWHATMSRPGALRDPGVRAVPAATDTGYPVRLADEAPIHGRAGCDRFVARVVRGIDPAAPSPHWLQRRVAQFGMRPISLAVDVTNVVMMALGQPLHAYDLARLDGPIVVRRARAGERITTLDGQDRAVHPEDLLITDGADSDDSGRAIGIAGVMGGAATEVSQGTTDVLIEAAHFEPVSIARTARRHKLPSEASRRFERGVDADVAAAAADLAVELLVRYGGGTPDPGVTDVDEREPRSAYDLDLGLPARLVGVPYARERIIQILTDIGCEVGDVDTSQSSHVSVIPPSWRPDLVNGPDYVEEVARIDGYDRIPSVPVTPVGGRGLTHGQRVRRAVASTLAGQGYVEVLTYPFVSEGLADQMGLPSDDDRRHAARLLNPISAEAPLLRTSVLDTLVEAVRRNVSRGQRDVALFEVGLVTRPGPEPRPAPIPGVDARPTDDELADLVASVPAQPRRVAFVRTGDADRDGWWGPGRPAGWTDVVETVRNLAAALSVPIVVSGDQEHAPWHPGRCARVTLADGTLVGHAGELHPQVLASLGLPPRTSAGVLDVDVLTSASEAPTQLAPFSTYPPATSDIALVVDVAVAAADVEAALREGAGPSLETVLLFDVYVGEQVGAGRKSLAYRLTFRAPDRTLTTEEVNGFRDAAVARAAEMVGAVQR